MRLNGNRITLERASKGLSIKGLATASGCSTATIQKATRGDDIWALTAGKIANALGVDLAALVESTSMGASDGVHKQD